MTRLSTLLAAGVLLAAPAGASAEVVATFAFVEGDDADTFTIRNVAPCPDITLKEVSIDFSAAATPVTFDPKRGGAGYDDSSLPFETLDGGAYVSGVSALTDGGQTITLALTDFDTGSSLEFALDVDGPNGAVEGPSEDVIGPDIAGATVAAKIVNAAGEERAEVGAMDRQGTGSVAWDAVCEDRVD